MSKKNLVAFLQFAVNDEQLAARMKHPMRFEDFKAIAAERGYDLGDLSAAEIKRTVEVVTGQQNEELSADELELVSAGAGRAGAANAPNGVYGDINGIRESFPEEYPWSFYEGWPQK